MTPFRKRIDVAEKSAEFAALVDGAQQEFGVTDERVDYLAGIEPTRLQRLKTAKEVFRSAELEILGVVLSIGLDQLFPLDPDIPDSEIHRVFEELRKDGIGLYAAASRPDPVEIPPDQPSFERAVVHLHYIAECLNQFPE